MQKVKPKWIFLFMLLFIVIITMLKDLNFPYSKVMFQIWEIQLPNHYKQLYEKNIFSLNGDGERYDHSKLYLIYDSKKKRIFIIEEIM